jgi:hypothetical protein
VQILGKGELTSEALFLLLKSDAGNIMAITVTI